MNVGCHPRATLLQLETPNGLQTIQHTMTVSVVTNTNSAAVYQKQNYKTADKKFETV